jgi:hypothetical protein
MEKHTRLSSSFPGSQPPKVFGSDRLLPHERFIATRTIGNRFASPGGNCTSPDAPPVGDTPPVGLVVNQAKLLSVLAEFRGKSHNLRVSSIVAAWSCLRHGSPTPTLCRTSLVFAPYGLKLPNPRVFSVGAGNGVIPRAYSIRIPPSDLRRTYVRLPTPQLRSSDHARPSRIELPILLDRSQTPHRRIPLLQHNRVAIRRHHHPLHSQIPQDLDYEIKSCYQLVCRTSVRCPLSREGPKVGSIAARQESVLIDTSEAPSSPDGANPRTSRVPGQAHRRLSARPSWRMPSPSPGR